MSTPGYYKINCRALTLRDLARTRGWLKALRDYVVTRAMAPTPLTYFPQLWSDQICAPEELSERFWQATAQQRQAYDRLGFTQVGLNRLKHVINPNTRDSGGICYLDSTRRHIGAIAYIRQHVRPPVDKDREQTAIGFAAAFEKTTLSYTNHVSVTNARPGLEVVHCRSDDVETIYRQFLAGVQRQPGNPRQFPDDASVRQFTDSNQEKLFEHLLRRKLLIRMTDAEVEAARSRLPPPLSPRIP